MDNLLFLCHRIPYPPNKGDKIRSFHFLQHLATRYRVHLGTFIDDPADEAWRDKVREYCADLCAVRIDPRWRRLLSLRGLLTGEPLGLPYYRDRGLATWVRRVLVEAKPRSALVFSSTMAQYLPDEAYRTMRTVVDFVDVDSEKWLAYAAAKPWPLSAIYRREGRRLRDYETGIARRAAASVFVSAPEAELFGSLLDPPLPTVRHVDNGVDLEYFHPDDTLPSPYVRGARVCVFTGAMDYWANVDAVAWFADEVFPRIQAACPSVEFWIVGSRPAPDVRALGQRPGIHVTGTVPDVRPYVQHALAVVAPLRIARGIQNKVLEGMAMNKPIVGTRAAFEGIRCGAHPALCVTDEPARFAEATVRFLQPGPSPAVDGPRRYVEATHDWRTNLTKLDTLLEA